MIEKVPMMTDLEHLVAKARSAKAGGINAMSTGEALAAALILNRSDWLASMGYTIAQALNRIDDEWIPLIPQAARVLAATDAYIGDARAAAQQECALAELSAAADGCVDVSAKLVSFGQAPGYRDAEFTFDLQRIGSGTSATRRVCLRINPGDGETVVRHILETHRLAWSEGGPIDRQAGEQRPLWIDSP
jgi:hypothetical protein